MEIRPLPAYGTLWQNNAPKGELARTMPLRSVEISIFTAEKLFTLAFGVGVLPIVNDVVVVVSLLVL